MKKFAESWKNEIIDDLKLSLKEVEQKDTIGIFKGIMETYDEFINDDNKIDGLEEIYKEQREDWTGELDDSSMMMMIFGDIVDREFIYYYSDTLFYNLYNLDSYYDKDEEGWISKHEEINNKTNYDLIWDNYYSIDTDVRESIGDILDNEIIDYMKKWNL
jgi:hypothetical protein